MPVQQSVRADQARTRRCKWSYCDNPMGAKVDHDDVCAPRGHQLIRLSPPKTTATRLAHYRRANVGFEEVVRNFDGDSARRRRRSRGRLTPQVRPHVLVDAVARGASQPARALFRRGFRLSRSSAYRRSFPPCCLFYPLGRPSARTNSCRLDLAPLQHSQAGPPRPSTRPSRPLSGHRCLSLSGRLQDAHRERHIFARAP